MDWAQTFALLAALSLAVTKGVDLVRNVVDKNDTVDKWVWNALAFAGGIGYCWGWEIDVMSSIFAGVPALADKATSLDGTAGHVLSGIVVGALAGFGHELLDALSGVAKKRA